MVKKGVVILLAGVLVFAIYRGFVSNFLVLREINFADEKKQSDKTKESMVDNIKTIYSSQALQAHDDYLGTYKGEESVWTNQVDGVVGDTGLSSGKIKKDERTGLWWSASSSSNKITNRLDVVNTDGLRVTGGNAVAFCDGLNKVAFGGKSDWYLPTQKELMQAYIDGIYSQDREFGTVNNFWSSTEQNLYNPKLIWYVNLSTGVVVDYVWSTRVSVRCVRRDDSGVDKTIYSSQALQAHDDYLGTYKGEESVWTNQVDGVVGDTGLSSGKIKKDERTGLWWSASSSSNKITNRLDVVNTDGLRVTGGNAVAFCDGLNKVAFGGKSDWYLPTQKELMQAYIDGIYSQDREFGGENPYWAATVLSSDNTTPVCVHMGWGYAFQEDKFITGYSVRCVRQDR